MVSHFLGTESIKTAEQFINMVRVYLAIFERQGGVQCEVVYPFRGFVEVQTNAVPFTDNCTEFLLPIRVHFLH